MKFRAMISREKRVLMGLLFAFGHANAQSQPESLCFARFYDPFNFFDEQTDDQRVGALFLKLTETNEKAFTATIIAYQAGNQMEGYGERELLCQELTSSEDELDLECASEPFLDGDIERAKIWIGWQAYASAPTETSAIAAAKIASSDLSVSHPIYPNDGLDRIPITDTNRPTTHFFLYPFNPIECQAYTDHAE